MIPMLLWLLACGTQAAIECNEEKSCPFGSSCFNGICQEQSCATSDQCAIEQHCSAEHICAAGCEVDGDCKFGDHCVEGLCEQKGCTNARTDCSFGQFCGVSGECYDAAGYYCRSCEDDFACGGSGSGNLCYGGYCAVSCETDRDCPNGYDCLPFTDINGNIISYQCYTYCWLME